MSKPEEETELPGPESIMPSLRMSRTGFGSANIGLNDRSQFSYALAAWDILGGRWGCQTHT